MKIYTILCLLEIFAFWRKKSTGEPVGGGTPDPSKGITTMIALAWLATLSSAAFTLLLLAKYSQRQQPVYLVWAVSLGFFAVASAAEASARLSVWTEVNAKIYYIFGAGLVAGFLGVGTLMLAAPRAGRIALGVAILASLLIIWQAAVTTVDAARLPAEGFKALRLPPLLRIPVILMNSVGSLLVLIPTVRSALRAARAREAWSRTWSLVLIAAGVFIIAGAHTLAGGLRLAPAASISIVNAVGVTLMFVGQILPAVDAWLAAPAGGMARAASPR